MSLPVIVRWPARQDVDAAYQWYERLQPGRGDDFLDEFRARAADIGRDPHFFGRVTRTTRAAPFPTFKYIIYYRVEPHAVVITAVQHAHANPASWRGRK